jgi:type IV pilus assembly protein PilE
MRTRSAPRRLRPAGFTLIEAMVTVAIVAILGALAYPNYVDYITRSRIIEGTSKLSDFRVRMEQFFMDNRTYQNGAACGLADQLAGAKDYFDITCVAPTAMTYTVTAQGVGPMSQFTYTVNQANTRRTAAAPAGWNMANQNICWITKKSGDC